MNSHRWSSPLVPTTKTLVRAASGEVVLRFLRAFHFRLPVLANPRARQAFHALSTPESESRLRIAPIDIPEMLDAIFNDLDTLKAQMMSSSVYRRGGAIISPLVPGPKAANECRCREPLSRVEVVPAVINVESGTDLLVCHTQAWKAVLL